MDLKPLRISRGDFFLSVFSVCEDCTMQLYSSTALFSILAFLGQNPVGPHMTLEQQRKKSLHCGSEKQVRALSPSFCLLRRKLHGQPNQSLCLNPTK